MGLVLVLQGRTPEQRLLVARKRAEIRILPQVVVELALVTVTVASPHGLYGVDVNDVALVVQLVEDQALGLVRDLADLHGHAPVMVCSRDEEVPVLVPDAVDLAVRKDVVATEACGRAVQKVLDPLADVDAGRGSVPALGAAPNEDVVSGIGVVRGVLVEEAL